MPLPTKPTLQLCKPKHSGEATWAQVPCHQQVKLPAYRVFPFRQLAPTTTGQVLAYNSTLSQWEAAAPGGVADADASTKGVVMLTGDLAGTGSSATAPVITNKAVTYAKMQDVAATSLIGNSTGSAATPEAVAVSNGLTLTSSAIKLGGDLTAATTINQNNNDLTVTHWNCKIHY